MRQSTGVAEKKPGSKVRSFPRLREMLVAAALASAAAPGALAQNDTIERLKQFRTTGTPLEIPTVPQAGDYADQLHRNLEDIELPPGFEIELYAVVPDARHMAIGTNASVAFVDRKSTRLNSSH